MTEKRFTHRKWYNERQLFDGEEPFAIVDIYTQSDKICDKLNELADENEQLKIKLEDITLEVENAKEFNDDAQYELYKLKKENEQLKQQIQTLYEDIDFLKLFIEKQGFKVKLDGDVE